MQPIPHLEQGKASGLLLIETTALVKQHFLPHIIDFTGGPSRLQHQVRRNLMKDRDWDDLAAKAAAGAFSTYDDAQDPDVKNIAALFAGNEHEGWASSDSTGMSMPPVASPKGSGTGDTGKGDTAPASSVHA